MNQTPTTVPKRCPKGTKKVNGKCLTESQRFFLVKPAPKRCPKGTKNINGKCFSETQRSLLPKPAPKARGRSRIHDTCKENERRVIRKNALGDKVVSCVRNDNVRRYIKKKEVRKPRKTLCKDDQKRVTRDKNRVCVKTSQLEQRKDFLKSLKEPRKSFREHLSVSKMRNSTTIKNDRSLVLRYVNTLDKPGSRTGFAAVSNEFRDDKQIVLAAIKKSIYSFEYASERLRNDKEVVMAAIKREDINPIDPFFGIGLKYASDTIRDNREVVLAALKRDGRFLEFASDRLKKDEELVLTALGFYTKKYMYFTFPFEKLPIEMRENEKIILRVISDKYGKIVGEYKENWIGANIDNYEGHVPKDKRDELGDNKKFMLAAVKVNGWITTSESVSQRLLDDEEIFKAGLKSKVNADIADALTFYASKRVRQLLKLK